LPISLLGFGDGVNSRETPLFRLCVTDVKKEGELRCRLPSADPGIAVFDGGVVAVVAAIVEVGLGSGSAVAGADDDGSNLTISSCAWINWAMDAGQTRVTERTRQGMGGLPCRG
jgi:hypothetical protein